MDYEDLKEGNIYKYCGNRNLVPLGKFDVCIDYVFYLDFFLNNIGLIMAKYKVNSHDESNSANIVEVLFKTKHYRKVCLRFGYSSVYTIKEPLFRKVNNGIFLRYKKKIRIKLLKKKVIYFKNVYPFNLLNKDLINHICSFA